MLLAFDAKQKLKLSVTRNKEYLSKYLWKDMETLPKAFVEKTYFFQNDF